MYDLCSTNGRAVWFSACCKVQGSAMIWLCLHGGYTCWQGLKRGCQQQFQKGIAGCRFSPVYGLNNTGADFYLYKEYGLNNTGANFYLYTS